MPQDFEITDEDIQYAEGILFSEGGSFDDKRINFIKNLETIDLQAVPGSGKTTALLAKLLILERKLPLKNGAGILVLSHTNTAIDEIKKKLQAHCPKLLSYPNFIGTIQSFVDKFLAIPCGHNLLGVRISWVDKDKYEESILSKFNKIAWDDSKGKPKSLFYGRHKDSAQKAAQLSTTKESVILDGLCNEEIKTLYFNYLFDEIKIWRTGETLLKDKANLKYKSIKVIIEEVFAHGIISYNYAYNLGEYYLSKFPDVATQLRKRFKYIFVDEMQDMDEIQYKLLESLFAPENTSNNIYQRIGDINQSIYNLVKLEDVWVQRNNLHSILGSHRLTKETAQIVNCFAHVSGDKYQIEGKRETLNKPHILLYTDETLENVIQCFNSLISDYRAKEQLPNFGKYPIKVIAWNTEWKTEEERQDKTKLRLTDYYPSYEKNLQKPKPDYDCLLAYLVYYDKRDSTLRAVSKNIINAILKCLRLENVLYGDSRYFTKTYLYKHLSEYDTKNGTNQIDELNSKLYLWSIKTIEGKMSEVQNEFTSYMAEFLKLFGSGVSKSSNFLSGSVLQEPIPVEADRDDDSTNNIDAISSVHSIKGETHCATLYLESAHGGKHESELLFDSFLRSTQNTLEQCNQTIEGLITEVKNRNGGRGTESRETKIKSEQTKINKIKTVTKMVYVGASRPTDLLCFAIHKGRFDMNLSSIDKNKWEIIEVT